MSSKINGLASYIDMVEVDVFYINSEFVIDGTGFKSIIGDKFNLKVENEELNIALNSRSIFTHFKGIVDFGKVLNESEKFVDRSPADRSRATQHHCFEGGWVWLIPFENGITSVGLNLDNDHYPMNDQGAKEEFWTIIDQFPIIKGLLSGKENVRPYIKTGRIQYFNKKMVGDRWAMLPASAYGLDGWFSTGLASSFIAIHRLVDILDNRVFPNKKFNRNELLDYELAMKIEYHHVSKMVHGIYKSFKNYDVFKNYCSLCFMGAESYLANGGAKKGMELSSLLLNAGDSEFVKKFDVIYKTIIELSEKDEVSEKDIASLNSYIREDMVDYNFRNFGDPEMRGMHPKVEVC
ncbi:MAG: tryptophan 7-halogenase [Oleispira sp.]|nr:tryptophan 7-halogenase [Oleispira sp.]